MSCELPNPAIRVVDATKCFLMYEKPHHRLVDGLLRERRHGREFWAIQSVSFDVFPGETLGIIGRNGAGKSTLLQMITGVLQLTSGTIEVAGKVAALLELGAGFNPDFTGRENARLNAAILGLSPRVIDERIESIIEFSELREFIDQPVKTYSSGMYVRLAFSVAIHVEPTVLVVDEALAVGDARFQAKCMDRIRKMKAAGTTILFVSHDVAAVRLLCDRALWLERGRVRMLGEVLQVTSQYMEALFEQDDALPAPEAGFLNDEPTPQPVPASKHKPPLVQWGSCVGSIIEAGLYDAQGERREVFFDDQTIEVRIRFRIPQGADRRSTGVAFSFKDVRGSDLIVATSMDTGTELPMGSELLEARYVLRNCLAPGDYLLVVALEDRGDGSIRYFDYIEGAQYFSTAFNSRVHGRFIPEIEQSIVGLDPAGRVNQCEPAA